MGIFYGMVARGLVVLAEFSASHHQGNASVVAKQILHKIDDDDDDDDDNGSNQQHQDINMSYSHDRYVFHVKRTDGLTVLCMADDASARRIPFAFMEDIHNKFVKTYGRAILSAPAYAMNDDFSRVLSQQMDYYSNDPNADTLNRIKGEMSHVRTVMIDNIEKVLERGDRLALLVEKTSAMEGNAIRFKRQSRRYKHTLWWRNFRLMAVLVFLFIIVLYIMLVVICHGPLLTSCRT